MLREEFLYSFVSIVKVFIIISLKLIFNTKEKKNAVKRSRLLTKMGQLVFY